MAGETDRVEEQRRIVREVAEELSGPRAEVHDVVAPIVAHPLTTELCLAKGPGGTCQFRLCTQPKGHLGAHRGRGCADCSTVIHWSDR